MNLLDFSFAGRTLSALASGALWDRQARLLCVSDLHLGKSDRIARRFGLMLPPYETQATLDRLSADIEATGPATVICLGDSFDDLEAADSLDRAARMTLAGLMAGRRWVWIEGNHDPGPVALGGSHMARHRDNGLTYRHIADPSEMAEVSGHYHPKHNIGTGGARACFLFDEARLILPAYGTYTGGLRSSTPELRRLFAARCFAILTGRQPILAPVPPPTRRLLRQ